jgi:dienelactone hydrolase
VRNAASLYPSETGTDAELVMKGPEAKDYLKRRRYGMGSIALFFMILESVWLPARGETFKFESKTSLASFNATIGGELSFPKGSGPFPVVILLHACGGLHPLEVAQLSAHARSLAMVGFATYVLDSFSARGLNHGEVCKSGGEASEFRLDDLYNAREALQKHPRVDKHKFFVAGFSHGASVALWAAVNVANRERFRAVAAFYPDCRALLHSLKLKSPVIVFAGGKDDWTPAPVCEEAKARERTPGEELELIMYPNAYHAFDQKRHDKFLGHVMIHDEQATADSQKKMEEFFLRYLPDDSPSSAKTGSNQNRRID